jgi:Kef-type K+ transport system membrane component KefB
MRENDVGSGFSRIPSIINSRSCCVSRDVMTSRRFLVAAPILCAAAVPLLAADTGHHDPVAPVVLGLAAILIVARLAGDVAVRLGQPAVLGELIAGAILGNVGVAWFEQIASDPAIDLFARIGVILLLFEVGLESSVGQLLSVGGSALLVALLGVAAPFALGWGVGAWLTPEAGPYAHAFLGATLCATSVGITARVLKDLNRSTSREATIILGAAVIDDVLGLLVLAVVAGAITSAAAGEGISYAAVGLVLAKAAVFLFGALVVGVLVSRRLFFVASRLRAHGVLLTVGLSICFLFAWLADVVGLASIVGAFAAGLILERTHYREFVERGEHSLEELIHPLSAFFVPVFFVLMGMRTELGAFLSPGVLGLATALTIAAIIGKQACSLGVLDRETDRLVVGIGMVPRGEVGLIFVSVGQALSLNGRPIVDAAIFSATIVMVIVTTLVTPPALKWAFERVRPGSSAR